MMEILFVRFMSSVFLNDLFRVIWIMDVEISLRGYQVQAWSTFTDVNYSYVYTCDELDIISLDDILTSKLFLHYCPLC